MLNVGPASAGAQPGPVFYGQGGTEPSFFFKDPATAGIYTSSHTLSLHDALPIYLVARRRSPESARGGREERRAHSLRSEEHTSELQSRELISYAVFCLKQKTSRTNACVFTNSLWRQEKRSPRTPTFCQVLESRSRQFFSKKKPQPQTSTQAHTLFPYTTLFR